MHTTKKGDTLFHHDSDYGTDVIINVDGTEIRVPSDDLKAFMAQWVRDSKTEALENASDDEILGLSK
jgi:hypothetical protein